MRVRNAAILLFALPAVAAAVSAFRRDKRAALARFRVHSRVINTRLGPVEVGEKGVGRPVIALHGMGGGSDQGLLVGSLLDHERYHVIAPSRPGNRRTPLSMGASFEDQADVIAALLDELRIDRAAVIGLSGGGFAALQFAIRHSSRCTGLVLLSAHGPATLDFLPDRRMLILFEAMVASDLPMWLAGRVRPEMMLLAEGASPARTQDVAVREMVRRFIDGVFPASEWKVGTRNDIERLLSLESAPAWPLEAISVPALVVHGVRDQFVRIESARRHAGRIRDARFVEYDDGTHMAFITHHSEIRAELADFLEMLVW